MKRALVGLVAAVCGTASGQTLPPFDSTYQGVLEVAGAPADGLFDFQFALFDVEAGGVASFTDSHANVPVTDGLFVIPDLATAIATLPGRTIWIEVRVRPAGGGTFTALLPRQRITPAPTAVNLRAWGTRQNLVAEYGGILTSQAPDFTEPLSLGSSVIDGNGFVELRDFDTGDTIILLDVNANGAADNGLFDIGSRNGGDGGEVIVRNDAGVETARVLGGRAAQGALVDLFTDSGARTLRIDGDSGNGSLLRMFDPATGLNTFTVDGLDVNGSRLQMFSGAGVTTVDIDSDSLGGGTAAFRAEDGSSTLFLDAESSNSGARVSVRNDLSEETVALVGDDGDDAGLIRVLNRNGTLNLPGVEIFGREAGTGTGGVVGVYSTTGDQTIELDGENGAGGDFIMREEDGSNEARIFNSQLTLFDGDGNATITMNGNTGAKNGVVSLPSFGQRLMYAVESTEVWFDDIGSSRLIDGRATVVLDPMFRESVVIDQNNPLKVFVTLTGPANGVWVEKFDNGFVVHELMNGASNATFDYRVVAKRRGLEHARMERFEAPDALSVDRPVVGRAARVMTVDGDDVPVLAPRMPETVVPAVNRPNAPRD